MDEASYKGGRWERTTPSPGITRPKEGGSGARRLGHTKEGYALPLFRKHLLGGIRYAAGLAPAGTAEAKADDRAAGSAGAGVSSKMMKKSGAAGFETMPVDEARKAFVGMVALAGPAESVAKIEDRTCPAAPRVRVYTPAGPGPKPALVYFHGGGWVLGSPETIDVPCRRLANASGCVVVSVDYRLAPEHHFPTPLDDCYAATRYVAEHAADVRR